MLRSKKFSPPLYPKIPEDKILYVIFPMTIPGMSKTWTFYEYFEELVPDSKIHLSFISKKQIRNAYLQEHGVTERDVSGINFKKLFNSKLKEAILSTTNLLVPIHIIVIDRNNPDSALKEFFQSD